MSAERPPEREPGDVERDETKSKGAFLMTVATRIANLLKPAVRPEVKVAGKADDASSMEDARAAQGPIAEEIDEETLIAWREEEAADWSTPEARAWLEQSRIRTKEETPRQSDFRELESIIKSRLS